ncbi:hypothetical protein EMCG_09006 [[Emmonsia] crescens]|uniref:Protein kinase domain-containing protein n=1 Tax=[Emmonsia] crescens TaxID=73230 RepID=A0A0G2I4H0_9EURO|nr:hypothetical protein EMCG_09006 [Emmonsia crescens UAMH 3008]
MARTLIQTHTRRVLVGDIAPRNFLLSTHLSIAFSDFNASTILPLDTDMRTADDHDEVIAGERCGFDLFKDLPGYATAVIPRRDSLPNLQDVCLGAIMEECWTKGTFEDECDLLTAFDMETLKHSLDAEKKLYSYIGFHNNIARDI